MRWDLCKSFLEACLADARLAWAELLRQFRPDPTQVRMTVRPSAPPVVIGPASVAGRSDALISTRGVVLVAPALPVQIEPASREAWDEYGWRRVERGRDTVYEGEYRAQTTRGEARTFPGRVLERGTQITAYIASPPPQIKRHPKGPCFQLLNPPWFTVHWHRGPTSVDDAILYVERILHEVLQ